MSRSLLFADQCPSHELKEHAGSADFQQSSNPPAAALSASKSIHKTLKFPTY